MAPKNISVAHVTVIGPPGSLCLSKLADVHVYRGEIGIATCQSDTHPNENHHRDCNASKDGNASAGVVFGADLVEQLQAASDGIGRAIELPFEWQHSNLSTGCSEAAEDRAYIDASFLQAHANYRKHGAAVVCLISSLDQVHAYISRLLHTLFPSAQACLKLQLLLAERCGADVTCDELYQSRLHNQMVFMHYCPGWTRVDNATELSLQHAEAHGGRAVFPVRFLLAELAASIGATAKYGT